MPIGIHSPYIDSSFKDELAFGLFRIEISPKISDLLCFMNGQIIALE